LTVALPTRRALIVAIAAAMAPPCASAADKPKRIGYIGPDPRPKQGERASFDAFFEEMLRLGLEEGRDYTVEWHVVENTPEGHATGAARIAASGVDLIYCRSTPQALAAKSATSTIPIVFAGISDPLSTGIVRSLAKPDGITGFTDDDAPPVSGFRYCASCCQTSLTWPYFGPPTMHRTADKLPGSKRTLASSA
jgi:putative ABC transport system substrate-binding protein